RAELRRRLGAQCIAPAIGLRETIRALPLPAGQPGDIFLFLFGCTEIEDRQGANTGVRTYGHGERKASAETFVYQGRSDKILTQPAEVFGNGGAKQSLLASLDDQRGHQSGLQLIDAVEDG